jgi:iron-sulfur cluster assembly accessory protein
LEKQVSEKTVALTEFEEDEQPPISFTTEAARAAEDAFLAEKMEAPNGLRVGLRGGGCAGFQYVLDFTGPNENDFVMDLGKVKVYIDPVSAMHLEGTTIDFVTSLMGMGFKFINPNATKTCGCGSSFG